MNDLEVVGMKLNANGFLWVMLHLTIIRKLQSVPNVAHGSSKSREITRCLSEQFTQIAYLAEFKVRCVYLREPFSRYETVQLFRLGEEVLLKTPLLAEAHLSGTTPSGVAIAPFPGSGSSSDACSTHHTT